MTSVFVAYAAGNSYHGQVIKEACLAATNASRAVTAWSQHDVSGSPIGRSVEGWIETTDAFVADVSVVNMNVTYELGYAIGLGRPVRLIRSTHVPFEAVRKVGLLDTLGHDTYDHKTVLSRILTQKAKSTTWSHVAKNKDQPLFVLQRPGTGDIGGRVLSAIKKIARVRFRNFNPSEISRLTASEAFQHAASSFGVVVFWMDGSSEEAGPNNQRAAFIYGVARGMNLPTLLVAHENSVLPLDLQDQADRFFKPSDLDRLVAEFRIGVADAQNDFVAIKPEHERLLEMLSCGDPVAENEASTLGEHFLQTDGYRRTLDGEANLLVPVSNLMRNEPGVG